MNQKSQCLIEHGADANTQGGVSGNALQAASYRDDDNIVQYLLAHEADVNAQGGIYETALQAASSQGNDVIVPLLLEHGANSSINEGGHAVDAQPTSPPSANLPPKKRRMPLWMS